MKISFINYFFEMHLGFRGLNGKKKSLYRHFQTQEEMSSHQKEVCFLDKPLEEEGRLPTTL